VPFASRQPKPERVGFRERPVDLLACGGAVAELEQRLGAEDRALDRERAEAGLVGVLRERRQPRRQRPGRLHGERRLRDAGLCDEREAAIRRLGRGERGLVGQLGCAFDVARA
jgi:hypothetical protein